MATTNTATVTALYQSIAGGQSPPAADLAVYAALLNSGTWTTSQVTTAIESSTFVQNVVNVVIREYQAAFGRVPDQAGLNYWIGVVAPSGPTGAVNAAALANLNTIFSGSAEFQTRYGTAVTPTTVITPANAVLVTALYTNVLGRSPDAAGLNYWLNAKVTLSQLLQSFAQSPEFVTLAAPAVAAYETAELTGSAPTTGSLLNVGPTTGLTLALTTGIDNLVGGTANDVFNAANTATSIVLGGLDIVDGGAGSNTFNISDTQYGVTGGTPFVLPVGMTIKNIQTLNITTNGSLGVGGAFDLSGQAGLTTANLIAADAQADNVASIKVGATTALNLTVAATDAVTVAGGTADTVTNGAGADVNGAALTSVSVTGNTGVIAINNGSATAANAAAADGAGTTLTSVTLSKDTGATAGITGKGISTVSWDAAVAQAVTVTNATVGAQTINLNLNGVGTSAAGAAVADSFTDNTATTINIVATGSNSVTVTDGVGATLKTLTVGGAGKLTLANAGVGAATTLTSINLAANSGGVALHDNSVAAVLTGGSGNDTVTLDAALTSAAGGSINLGAGNNTLLFGTGSIGAGVVVNGGTGGTNVISAALVNAGNAATITNFQALDVSGFGAGAGNGALDTSLLGSAVTGVNISTAATNGLATLLNLGANVTVTDTLDLAAAGSLTLSHAGTATTNTLAINFAETSKTSVLVETISALTSKGDASITIASGGASTGAGFGNAITALTETDNNLATITVTGAKAFTLGSVTETVSNATLPTLGYTLGALTKIDGSAATGALTITAGADTGAVNNIVRYTGLSILGGTGGDTIINHARTGVITEGATLATNVNHLTVDATGASIIDTASAGADVITLSGSGNSATLGSGTGVAVTVSANVNLSDTVTVTYGTGTATVTDSLLYGVAAGNQTSATTGDLVVLGGTFHGNTVAFSAAIATAAGALGAAANVGAAQTFDQAVFIALGGAAGGAASSTTTAAVNTVDWFQYGGNTYIVDAGGTAPGAGAAATAEVVKLVGVVDLSHAVINAAGAGITFA